MKRFAYFFALTGLALLSAAAEDVTGKWTGSISITRPNGESKDAGAVLVLKQTGTEITGTVGPSGDEQSTIQKGVIAADKVTLQLTADGADVKFDLTLADGHLKGTGEAKHEGQIMQLKLDVTRAN